MLTEYIAVDLEMTGLNSSRDKILEIGAVHVRNGEFLREYETLVNPGIPIPPEITKLTGITDDMAQKGVCIPEAMREFLGFAEDLPLVGHNILYDYSFLKQNAVNCNLGLEVPVLDTLKLSRQLPVASEKKTLESLCVYFHIRRAREHRALEDAKAAAKLYERLKDEYQELRPELFEASALSYKVKKQGPITLKQKKYLKELSDYHKIELMVDIDSLTRSEASRLTDKILSQYGRMAKKTR